MSLPPLITAHQVVKTYGPRPTLDHVSVALDPGERVGLIGANGSGKSTLAKLLLGYEQPDEGTIARARGLRVSYLPQEPQLDPDRSIFETVELGLGEWVAVRDRLQTLTEQMSAGNAKEKQSARDEYDPTVVAFEQLGGWDQEHRVHTYLEHLGLANPERKVGTLSGGERRRVALAQLLIARPQLAVLDEPTNHLDADTAEWLEEHLAEEFPGAVLLITHDRYFLDRVATRVWELDRGKLSVFEGNYGRYLELRAERDAQEAREEANRLNLLRRERDWLSRSAPARTSKQKARIQRAGELEKTQQTLHRRLETVSFDLAHEASSRRVLELKKVTRALGGKTLFKELDLFVMPGERIGIIGPNGAGKSTLLRTILKIDEPDAGTVLHSPSLKVMYFDQERSGLEEDKTVLDNVRQGSDRVRVGEQWLNVHAYLERFLFDAAKQRQAVSTLSGGERARLALARMLRGESNLLVLDEPTNDLDLPTLATLEEMLLTFAGAALIVTHDRYFLDRVATSILSFDGEEKVVRYAGNYEDYRVQKLAAEREKNSEVLKSEVRKETAPERSAESKKKPAKTLTWAEERELEGLPERIDVAEKAVAALDEQLNDPTLYAQRGSEVPALKSKREAQQKTLDELLARWEQLESKKG